MVDKLNYTTILKGDYNFFSLRYFFGLGDEHYSWDPIRIIKLLYILISLILNLLIIISLLKKKTSKFSIALILTGNILIINFIHTFSYSFEWILKEEDKNHTKILYINENGTVLNNKTINFNDSKYYEIGGLLVGNILNSEACEAQGFLLIFSALSQDMLINIFFFIVNKSQLPSKSCIRLFVIVLGYCFPFIVALIFRGIDGLGINDKFCYIKKFSVEYDSNLANYIYTFNKNQFHILIYIIYGIRTINLLFSLFLLFKIIKYVNDNKIKNKNIYILKSSSILIVQVITIIVGLIYRLSSVVHESFSRKFTNIFLCINTLDGIFFPLSYSLSNGVYKNLCCGISSKDSLVSLTDDQDVTKSTSINSIFHPSPAIEKTFAMVDVKDVNNFSLSYA